MPDFEEHGGRIFEEMVGAMAGLEPSKPCLPLVRDGLWCERCMTSSRVEQDVRAAGVLVATLEGCTRCRTGLCDQVGSGSKPKPRRLRRNGRSVPLR